jgi:hypothetical protein
VDQLIRRWPDDADMGTHLFKVAHTWEQADRHDLAHALFIRARQSFTGTEAYRTAEGLNVLIAKSRAMAALVNEGGSNTQSAVGALITLSRRSALVNPKLLYETGIAYAKAALKTQAQNLLSEGAQNAGPSATLEDRQYAALCYLNLNQDAQAEAVMEDVYRNLTHERKYGEAIYDFGLAYYTRAVHYVPDQTEQVTRAKQTRAYHWLSRYIADCPFHEDWTPMAQTG